MRRPEEQTASEIAALLHDQPFCVSRDIIRNVKTLYRRFANEGFSFLTKTLPSLCKRIDSALSGNVAFSLPTAFKGFKKTCIPHFLGSALRRIFDNDGLLLDNPCYDTVRWLRTVLYYAYKIEVPFNEQDTQRFSENFMSVDKEIDLFVFDTSTEKLRNVMRHQLAHLNEELAEPSFGPGISSNCKRHQKYAQYVPPSPLRNHFGRDFFHLSTEWMMMEYASIVYWFYCSYFLAYFGLDLYKRGDEIHPIAPSTILFVPKDSRGPRVICCEDSRLMYAQKALQKSLYSQVARSAIFGGFVNFTDQSINQRLTFDKSFATIDLKDASDRVSLDLVKDIFPQKLLQSMLACRSQVGLLRHYNGINNYTFRMKKFAPMGSALCFPVMALCSYTAVVSAIYLAGGATPSTQRDVFVYGDDIIVKNEWASVAMSALESIGLKVNRDKSFVNSRFTESCGQDTLDQATVTPIRKKRMCSKPKLVRFRGRAALQDDGGFAHAVSLINRSAELGYKNLSSCIEKSVTSYYGTLPYGTADSPYPCKVVSEADVYAYNCAEGLEVNGKLRTFAVLSDKDLYEDSPDGMSAVRRSLANVGSSNALSNKMRIRNRSDIRDFALYISDQRLSANDSKYIGARRVYLQKRTFVKWGSSYSA